MTIYEEQPTILTKTVAGKMTGQNNMIFGGLCAF